jgi:hypothetical protein
VVFAGYLMKMLSAAAYFRRRDWNIHFLDSTDVARCTAMDRKRRFEMYAIASEELTKGLRVKPEHEKWETTMGFGKGALLWLLGVPLPIIILLALFWHH